MTKAAATLPVDWIQTAASVFELPADAGEDLTIGLTLTGGPEGDSASTWRFSQASFSGEPIGSSDVDLAIQLPLSDAVSVWGAKAEPAVLYMQGRLKTTGDNNVLLRLLKASASESFADWRSRWSTESL